LPVNCRPGDFSGGRSYNGAPVGGTGEVKRNRILAWRESSSSSSSVVHRNKARFPLSYVAAMRPDADTVSLYITVYCPPLVRELQFQIDCEKRQIRCVLIRAEF